MCPGKARADSTSRSTGEVLLTPDNRHGCCQQYLDPLAAIRLQRVPFFVVAAHCDVVAAGGLFLCGSGDETRP
jgi:hypothetical protein